MCAHKHRHPPSVTVTHNASLKAISGISHRNCEHPSKLTFKKIWQWSMLMFFPQWNAPNCTELWWLLFFLLLGNKSGRQFIKAEEELPNTGRSQPMCWAAKQKHLWCSRAAIFLPWQRLHLPQSHLQPQSQNINDFQPFCKSAFTLTSPLQYIRNRWHT